MGRKSNATLAAEAAAKAATETQELGKIETVDGEVVVTDLEPVSGPIDTDTEINAVLEAPVASSVDPDGEDLGDVTNQLVETPVIEAGEPVEAAIEVTELPEGADLATMSINDQVEAALDVGVIPDPDDDLASFVYVLEDGFVPILHPTMVGDKRIGHIPVPKAVFDLVQTRTWQFMIDTHPAKHALKSVLYWKNKNGKAVVRCMSSSKFADVL